MKTVDEMITYLEEAFEYNTQNDIYELPRPEFAKYIERCRYYVPPKIIPYCVFFMLKEEQASLKERIKRLLKWPHR